MDYWFARSKRNQSSWTMPQAYKQPKESANLVTRLSDPRWHQIQQDYQRHIQNIQPVRYGSESVWNIEPRKFRQHAAKESNAEDQVNSWKWDRRWYDLRHPQQANRLQAILKAKATTKESSKSFWLSPIKNFREERKTPESLRSIR